MNQATTILTCSGLPLGTPLLFDVGVFLTVLGAVLHMLLGLLEREA